MLSTSAFSLPAEWQPHVHVRRGGGVPAGAVVEAGAVEEVRAALAEKLPVVEEVLAEATTSS